ncbi:hypothetical protein RJ640_001886 [Escallonia rubra]|uniref:Uncharacterized protein n=1 Tax=Escallonia rubra TaxID=112253 RepID=A0AA88S4L4_9ASTE|nr:hypothetical protein RJ640_001886 [Escallonia rubra]
MANYLGFDVNDLELTAVRSDSDHFCYYDWTSYSKFKCYYDWTTSVIIVKAYTPQVIAFGPYHHMEPELYQMEKYKLATVKSSLSLEQILNFQELVIEKLKELEPVIRACYHKYLDHDGDALAWIIAIDGLFLLEILRGYGHVKHSQRRNLKQDAVLCGDVMMLENQIPVTLLKEIRKNLQLTSA